MVDNPRPRASSIRAPFRLWHGIEWFHWPSGFFKSCLYCLSFCELAINDGVKVGLHECMLLCMDKYDMHVWFYSYIYKYVCVFLCMYACMREWKEVNDNVDLFPLCPSTNKEVNEHTLALGLELNRFLDCIDSSIMSFARLLVYMCVCLTFSLSIYWDRNCFSVCLYVNCLILCQLSVRLLVFLWYFVELKIR